MHEKKIAPRATITKSMPLKDWERRQAPPQKELTFEEKARALRDRVVLRHLEQQYEDFLGDKKNVAKMECSTIVNDLNKIT